MSWSSSYTEYESYISYIISTPTLSVDNLINNSLLFTNQVDVKAEH